MRKQIKNIAVDKAAELIHSGTIVLPLESQ